jgi:hypothetical protein
MITSKTVPPMKVDAPLPKKKVETKLLKKIQSRHLDEVLDNMTVAIAAEVSRRYLLPMFDADARV